MTLTQTDLQQIRTVVHDVIQDELTPVKQDITSLKQDTEELKKGQRSIKRQLTRVKKDIKYISKDFDERIAKNARSIKELQQN